MAWLAPNLGLLELIDDIKTGRLAASHVGLFTTAHTPVAGDTLSTYAAIEAAWSGYARQNAFAWTTPAIDGSNRAVTYSQLCVFPVTGSPGSVTVFGYFVETGGTALLWAESITPTIVPIADVPVSLVARFFLANL